MRILLESENKKGNKFEIGKIYWGQYPNGSPAGYKVINRTLKTVKVARKNFPEQVITCKISLSSYDNSETIYIKSADVFVDSKDTFNSKEEFNKWAEEVGAKLVV